MSTVSYLVDTSAAVRLLLDKTLDDRWGAALREGLLGLCDLTELEVLYSAKSFHDRAEKRQLLGRLFGWCPTPDGVERRAHTVQELLTRHGEHRSAGPVDLLVAATAELNGLTVLHYDRDFATIARRTGQPAQWLAEPGTI
ncbi:PIN domain nuclease [Streptomyces armeniacus]|uniref:Ribonuclease VapC n=1 Tax=Streptomyces armeniacus TaxID=83291 RepID=A0A345XQF9_9ACTN|nr:PIN domain nuclease [Streptomyces armeniacus]AXK33875.1 PIN domain nuclease [Streptomyces armeniacus]